MLERIKPKYGIESRTRAGHSLHECVDGGTFEAAFRRCWGESVTECIRPLISGSSAEAVLLVGSIPFGIGSAGSDLDFIVLVERNGFVVAPEAASESQLIYFGRYSNSGGEIELANLVMKRGEVEVDLLFVDIAVLTELVRRIGRGGIALTREQIQLLGRIRKGWMLSCSDRGKQAIETLNSDKSFDLFCATRFLRNALKDLEHARLAIGGGELALACYLGRACVEKTAQAVFATQGLVGLSTKWLRRLKEQEKSACFGDWSLPVATETVRLLFPPAPTSKDDASAYLNDVSFFYSTVLNDMSRNDMALRVSMDLCPQIYNPSVNEGLA